MFQPSIFLYFSDVQPWAHISKEREHITRVHRDLETSLITRALFGVLLLFCYKMQCGSVSLIILGSLQ